MTCGVLLWAGSSYSEILESPGISSHPRDFSISETSTANIATQSPKFPICYLNRTNINRRTFFFSRWGNSPLDDAKKFKHSHVIKFMEEYDHRMKEQSVNQKVVNGNPDDINDFLKNKNED